MFNDSIIEEFNQARSSERVRLLKKCNPLRIYRAYIRRGASITPLDMLNLNVPQSGIHKKWLSNHF